MTCSIISPLRSGSTVKGAPFSNSKTNKSNPHKEKAEVNNNG
jgi:hypothetical protein